MSTDVLERPDIAQPETTDNLDHYWCCDPDVSRCGMDISDSEDVDEDEDLDDPCAMCELLAETDCGHPLCPYRNVRRVSL